VLIAYKALHVVLIANLIIKPYNRQSARLARVATGADYAKLGGGLWCLVNMRLFAAAVTFLPGLSLLNDKFLLCFRRHWFLFPPVLNW